MKTSIKLLLGAALLAEASGAFAGAGFKAVVENNKIVVYSTAEIRESCTISVKYSFAESDGTRVMKTLGCSSAVVPRIKARYCITPELNFPKVESEVTSSCTIIR